MVYASVGYSTLTGDEAPDLFKFSDCLARFGSPDLTWGALEILDTIGSLNYGILGFALD